MDEGMDYRGLSKYLKFAEGTLRHKVMRGEIPSFKIGGGVRFAKKDIDLWLEEEKKKPKKRRAKKGGEKENAGAGLFPDGGVLG
jgi:excisionase family DNA binding protein